MSIQSLLDQTSLDDTGNDANYQFHIQFEEGFLAGFIAQVMDKKFNPYPFITENHFTDTFLKKLHATVCDFLKNNLSVDFISLSASFHDSTEKQYVILLSDKIESNTTTKSYAFYLDSNYKANVLQSELLDASNTIRKEGSTCTPKILNTLKNLTRSIAEKTYSPFTQDDCFDDFNEELEKYGDNYLTKKNATSTGITQLDKMLNGGFHNSNLIIIGGRPSMGKSALAILFMNNVLGQGKTVLNFSFEMTTDEIVSRLVSLFNYNFGDGDISYSDLMSKKIPHHKVLEIVNNMKSGDFPLINNYKRLSIDNVCAYAERIAHDLLKKGRRLDMIFIDYLQIIIKPSQAKTTNDALSEITGKITELAKKLAVPIILLSQLNRDVEKERDILSKRPNASHLRESGAIEQDAHVIMFPFRPCFYEKNTPPQNRKFKEDYIELCIDKNRQGTVGLVKAYCDMAKNYIGDRDENDDGMMDIIEVTAALGRFERGN